MRFSSHVAAGTLALAPLVAGIDLTINDTESVHSAAKTIAYGMVKYYHGNESGGVPGLLGDPYYWWECGAMFNSLINYWYYTGDSTYNEIVKQGLLFQTGTDNNYMPINETKNEGNDDQVFWGFAVMSAAEYKFTDPGDNEPGWLALAQGVFNSQAARWDSDHCGGGLRWQIFTWNNGYNYKNSPSNGGLFNMAARLYAYTGNETYAHWANKVWNWMEDTVGLIGDAYEIYDGTQISNNCTSLDHTRWSYTQGMMLNGAAVMWNMTNTTEWKTRTEGLFNATAYFFNEQKVMREVCEASDNCNLDEQSFKAYLARFMAASTKSAPFLYDQVIEYLDASAVAAAAQCDGGTDGVTCGMAWTKNSTYDGNYGVGEQMAALEVVQSTLIKKATAPVSSSTGGTSQGDPSAGTSGDTSNAAAPTSKITTADRAGAGIVTVFLCLGTAAGGYWLIA
ncbi:mannan endo-1,6-alpha-mannosidase [Lecanosticta acicola]|uniref:Mannan endo-1,6-alpha-mannosidase n=1 Tax=Lecanosticta acicola TaxID=111012 RepID=A0AAI8Z1H8_9PEZI|nr:mannan endo-1,6-alpha-mannosidase [Lecanosticta acicola]